MPAILIDLARQEQERMARAAEAESAIESAADLWLLMSAAAAHLPERLHGLDDLQLQAVREGLSLAVEGADKYGFEAALQILGTMLHLSDLELARRRLVAFAGGVN